VAHWACGAGASPQFCAAVPARHTAGATLARTLGFTRRTMYTVRSIKTKRLSVGAIAWSICGLAAAQAIADVPAAVLTGTCKSIDFNRALLSSQLTVDLLAEVDETGTAVSAVPLSEVANARLLSAVISSVMSCKFQPARSGTKGIPGKVRLVYQFGPAPSAEPLGRRPAITDVKSCAPTGDDYPPASRQLNETGTTRISFTISPEGRLTAFGVVRSSGFLRLDFTALIKLAGCKFRPGTAPDGTPTGGSFDVEYVWKLE
jgi:TonB family protein